MSILTGEILASRTKQNRRTWPPVVDSSLMGRGRWSHHRNLVAAAVVASLERRLIVVAGGRPILAGAIGGRGAPQTRLVGVFQIVWLAAVFKQRQTRLDVVEFGRSHRIFLLRRQDLLDLFLGLGNAIWGLRMRSKSLGQRPRLLLFHGLQLLEEGNERLRFVSCLIHILQSEVVGFSLE